MILNFERIDSRWYLKNDKWEGSKEELQMIAGADTLIDFLSKGESLKINVWTEKEHTENNKNYFHAISLGKGNYRMGVFTFWLCSVTEWVFGYMPTDLYFRVVEQ